MTTRRIVLTSIGALFMAGCGLLIGLEDRELPVEGSTLDGAVVVPDGNAEPDATSTDGAVDAGADADAKADACACAVGCDTEGRCLSDLVSISVGRNHQCIVRADGKLFCIGSNTTYQLATAFPTTSNVYLPVNATDGGFPILWKAVSAGGHSTCALSRSDDLYCWGVNSTEQLGHDNAASMTNPKTTIEPTKVNLGGLKVKSFSMGSHRACAIVETAQPTDPNIRCWGYAANGELGTGLNPRGDGGIEAGTANDWTQEAATVVGLRAKTVQANDTDGDTVSGRVCALSEGDVPFCWGLTNNLEIVNAASLGTVQLCTPRDLGPFYCLLAPRAFDTTAIAVGTGLYYVCELVGPLAGGTANRLRCRGNAGVLVPTNCVISPELFDITLPAGVNPKKLVAGSTHLCVVDAQDEVHCLGSNDWTQVGVPGSDKCGPSVNGGADLRSAEPAHILGPDNLPLKAQLLAVGRANTLVYTKQKTLVGWGWTTGDVLGAGDAGATNVDAGASCISSTCSKPRIVPQPAYP